MAILQVAGSLACAKRGWVNVDVAKIECEICGRSSTMMCSSKLECGNEEDDSEDDGS